MQLIEYPDRDMMAIDVANVIAEDLENALLVHDRASLAVPGGTTPGPVFDVLCAADLDWSRVDILLTDERWVPEDHAESNAALLRSRLLTDRAAQARFVPFFRDGMALGDAAPEVSAVIDTILPISVLMLGMGADMHTASLFPAAEGLETALRPDASNLCPIKPKGHATHRITLSANALNGALSKHLLITGDDKRAAFERAQHLDKHDAPVRAILDHTTVHWAA